MYASGKKWQAQLRYDGKFRYLGAFTTKEEAAVVYDKAVREHRGSTAVCNFTTAEEGETAAAAAIGEWEQQNPNSAKSAQPKPRPKSGFYGVCANGNKWQAQLHYDGKQHTLGTFNTKEEAAAVYDEAAARAERQCSGV